ncbi:MAG: DUF2497 domain-containing protein [Hyphomicrobium sp.]|nr:DUF2497 domain-containing protein [Hyphomicrobium sp.]
MDRNGQPSMEEILASIRRIIAEEPGASSHPLIDLTSGAATIHADSALDDTADFELPSMFRAPQAPPVDRPTPLFNRLTEAIRAASQTNNAPAPSSFGGKSDPARPGDLSLSTLRLSRANVAEEANAAAFRLSVFHDNVPGQGPGQGQTPGGHAQGASSAGPEAAAGYPTDPGFASGSDAPVPFQSAYSEAQSASGSTVPNSGHQAATDNPSPNAPVVPRRMAAFKDTRFAGMSATAPGPAAGFASAPVETQTPAATAFASSALGDANPKVSDLFAAAMSSEQSLPATGPGAEGNYPLASDRLDAASPYAMSSGPAGTSQPPPIPDPFSSAPIEDATADLLRPMLRQWLAENMPRMVEKALHIEVAETVRSGKKPGQL